jgi:hypothetical protein
MEENRIPKRILSMQLEATRPRGRPRNRWQDEVSRCRWEDNIKMDLQEVGWGCGDWMELAQDRGRWQAFVSMVKNLRIP